jgi:hypothetical protein
MLLRVSDMPSPGALGVGLAENAHVIQLGIPRELAVGALHFLEDLFQAHDGGGFDETALAQTGIQQAVGEMPLGVG